jgi:GNAT superfamily N-acetyltransferase
MITIEKLTKKHLEEASALANFVFKSEPILPGVAFEASLDKKKFEELNGISENKIASLEYFVAVDKAEKVLGTTGLYSLEKDKKDVCWLGWYCVDSKFRGKHIGSKLLDYSIDLARERGKKFLHLYTSPSDDEKKAQNVYDSRGFKTTGTEKNEKNKFEIIYKELKL